MMLMTETVRKKEEESDLLLEDAPSFKVVLFNDEVNTFDWVISCLMEICDHDSIQAEQCALLVHYKGKAIVKNGDLEEMQAICQALCDSNLSANIE